MLTQSRLKELLHYCPETGVFTWRSNHAPRAKTGQQAGHQGTGGYRSIKLSGKHYKEHRLAWIYMTGEFPKDIIDHIDGNPANNAFGNLRDVNMQINKQNLKKCRSDNKSSGVLGVHYRKSTNRYLAVIFIDKRNKFLGSFKTKEEAENAYLTHKRLFHAGNTL